MIGPGVHVVSGLAFPHRVRLSNTAAPYDGLVVEASADPLASPGAFLRYELDGALCFGYLQTRLAQEVRGARWGMGLLYDVDPDASARPPRPNRELGPRFRRRAEVEFGDAH